jgi:hypothetical protein
MDIRTQSFSPIIKLGLHRTINVYEIVEKYLWVIRKFNMRMSVDITFNIQGVTTKVIA